MKEILLTRGLVAKVSDEDYDFCNQFKWYALRSNGGFYAVRHATENHDKIEFLHDYVAKRMNLNGQIDHEDRDCLNDQRHNLRETTRRGNAQNSGIRVDNTTGFKGVSYDHRLGKYRTKIQLARKEQFNIGSFDTAIEAARAYDRVAKRYQQFPYLNFPGE